MIFKGSAVALITPFNEDKSVTINGTANPLSYISQNITLKAGNYILKGCEEGSVSTYHLAVLINGEKQIISRAYAHEFKNITTFSNMGEEMYHINFK